MHKTVGVLGGMGPEATADYFRRLVELTPAKKDQDHLPVIILSDPRIPDRTEYLLGSGESPLPRLLRLAESLQNFGADLIAMPCNTAHIFWAEISRSVSVPVLNMVSETAEDIRRTLEGRGETARGEVGILATSGTIRSALYQRALVDRGLVPLVPTEDAQREVHQVIGWIKAQAKREECALRLSSIIRFFTERGAAGVILGCTELGLVGTLLRSEIPVFDSLTALARATVREASAGYPVVVEGEKSPRTKARSI